MLHYVDAQGRLLTVSDLAGQDGLRAAGDRAQFGRLPPRPSRTTTPATWSTRYLRDGRCDLIEYQMVRKDGTLIDVLLSATMERDAQGHPLRSWPSSNASPRSTR